jgi:hypothetical protein
MKAGIQDWRKFQKRLIRRLTQEGITNKYNKFTSEDQDEGRETILLIDSNDGLETRRRKMVDLFQECGLSYPHALQDPFRNGADHAIIASQTNPVR